LNDNKDESRNNDGYDIISKCT